MKRFFNAMAITIAVIGIAGLSAQAAVPQLINYQGRLTDGGGAPVADGAQLMKFTIYDAAVGGTSLWNSGFQSVTTTNGLFSYDLGSNVALPDDLFTDTSRYLGITVGVDPEISPRTRLETSSYAYHALRADTALFSESLVGVTQAIGEGDVIATGFLNLLLTDSINCPTDGFVMMNMTLTVNCNHTNGDNDVAFLMALDSLGTILQDQDNRAWVVPAALPTASYSTFVHIHKVFSVPAGWNTFFGLGTQNPGGGTDNFSSSDVTISLLFIPQSFGTVAAGSPTPPNSQFNSLPKKEK